MSYQVEDISKVVPVRNHIIIKAGPENRYLKLTDDFQIQIDTSYEPEKHSVTWGEVVCVPASIDSDLQTTMEVKVGDKIYFHYLCIMNGIQQKKFIVCKGELYFIVKYESMYCCKRGEEVVPINGWMLVEPIDDSLPEKTNWGFYIPDNTRKKENKNQGIVRYMGNPLLGEKNLVSEGDRIFFVNAANVPMQYDMHASFEGNKKYFRMKNQHILGVIN